MLIFAVVAPIATSSSATAEPKRARSRVGDTYQITMIRQTTQRSGDESSGNSYDKDTLIERVVGVRPDGLELEYDLPRESQDRSSNWQFPARVFRPAHGTPQLLNRTELEANLERWLKAAKWTRAVCGQWIFTWSAFQIECDPQSVVKDIEAFDLTSTEVRDGAPYRDPDARGQATLVSRVAPTGGASFAAEMEVDADAVRRGRAESDVVVGNILQKPITLEAALLERTKQEVSGTISVRFDTDTSGNVIRRTKVTKLITKPASGPSELVTSTETLERRLIARRRR
jgi:hypothetical protein